MVVGLDPYSCALYAGSLEVQLLDVRHAPGGEQDLFRTHFVFIRAVPRRDGGDDFVPVPASALDEDGGFDPDPLLLESRHEHRGGLRVRGGADPLQRVDDRDLGAEAPEDLAEL